MRPEYGAFIMAIQGWATQPILLELENLLASQEALAKQLAGMTVKHEEEKTLYSGRRGESSRDQYKRQPEMEKVGREQGKRCTCCGGAPRGQEGGGAEHGGSRSRSLVCYNCGRQGHYARECRFRKEEGNLVVAAKEEAPEKVPSEEDWDILATVAIQSMADLEDAEEAGEPEEEIDFESWFFEEPVEELVKKEIGVVSYTVVAEEKPQKSAEEEAVTEEGDEVETTQRSVDDTERREVMREDATRQVISREKEARRRLVPRPRENRIPNVRHRDVRRQTSEQCQAQRVCRRVKKHDNPDGRGVPRWKINQVGAEMEC